METCCKTGSLLSRKRRPELAGPTAQESSRTHVGYSLATLMATRGQEGSHPKAWGMFCENRQPTLEGPPTQKAS